MYICDKGHKVRDRDRTDSQLSVSSSTAHFTKNWYSFLSLEEERGKLRMWLLTLAPLFCVGSLVWAREEVTFTLGELLYFEFNLQSNVYTLKLIEGCLS